MRQARVIDPDDPRVLDGDVRLFVPRGVQSIPRREALLHNAIERALPAGVFEPGFLRRVADVVAEQIGSEIDFEFHAVRLVEATRLRTLIPGTTCLVVVGLPPRDEKILCEIDLQFAHRAVQRLLGTRGAVSLVERPLTDIEQGVLMFVLLKVLALFQESFYNPAQVGLRLEDIRTDMRSTADIVRTDSHWYVSTWRWLFDRDLKSVRLLVPEGLARAVLRAPEVDYPWYRERVVRRLRAHLDLLDAVRVDAWIAAGTLQLSNAELSRLDPGDIVLFDDVSISFADGQVVGEAKLRVGIGEHGFIKGDVMTSDGRHVFQAREVVAEKRPHVHDPYGEEHEEANPEEVVAAFEDRPPSSIAAGDDEPDLVRPVMGTPDTVGNVASDDVFDEDYGIDDEDDAAGDDDDEEYGEAPDGEEYPGDDGADEDAPSGDESDEAVDDRPHDNLDELQPLLGDIPLVVTVELARVTLSADEILRIRSGHIVELGRAATDPVDLVVNGKLIGRGEIIEMDGALGVRLIEVASRGQG